MPRSGVASWFGLGRIGERRRWKRAIGVAVVAGEHRDRGNDARLPVPDEFPCPQDPDDQQCDQQVADQSDSATAVRIQDENDAAASSDANVARRRAISQSCRGTCRRGTWLEKMDRVPAAVKKMPMTANYGGRIPDIVPGYEAEQRDRQRIGERQDAGPRGPVGLRPGGHRVTGSATVMATNNRPVSEERSQ